MLRKSRSTSASHAVQPPDATILLLRAELADLRQLVEMLQVESLTHLRRIGELQYEIDILKRPIAAPIQERVRARADGPVEWMTVTGLRRDRPLSDVV